jgi:hypothetical protein
VAPKVKAKPLTVGVVVTVWVDVIGPLQPAALAVMTDVPLQPATYVNKPVVELMELPPAILVASRL